MKKTIFYLILLGFLVFFVLKNSNHSTPSNGNIQVDKPTFEESPNDLASVPKPNTVSFKNDYSKSNTTDTNLKQKLIEMVEIEQDGSAAFQLVSLNSICSFAKLTDADLQTVINSLGNVLLEDPTGRNFFNQTLIYPGVEINSFDDLSKNLTNKEPQCVGFEKDDYERIFYYLNVAAERGYAEAKVGLWKMSSPSYVKHKSLHQKDPNNLEYLKHVEAEHEWIAVKRQYLKEAAEYGESRAWVLIADAMSSENWESPNIKEAYMYYQAAAEIYGLPFIYDQIERLESVISENEKEEAKIRAEKLLELHSERF